MKRPNLTNLLLILSLFIIVGLGCKPSAKTESVSVSKRSSSLHEDSPKLDEYSIKGFRFVYYKVQPDLDRAELIKTAQKLHNLEPDAQLLLVDDDSHLKDYITYAKAASGAGDVDKSELPKEWADKHIIANVQKYIGGKFVLCEGNGYKEIAELE